jgi:hypothetical protein
MNTYHAFYHGKRIEVTADTSYAAQLKAASLFKARRSYDVHVVVVAIEATPVIHSTAEL